MRQAVGNTGVSLCYLLICVFTNGSVRFLDLILIGSGLYKEIKTTVCSIYPKIRGVTVDYSDNSQFFNSSFPNFINVTEPLGGEDAPWLGDFAISVFLKGLTVGQSTTGNTMGDTILSFVGALPNGTDVLSNVLVSFVLDTRRPTTLRNARASLST